MKTEDIKKEYFPIFMPSMGKKVLIVGAGNIALRRAKTLLKFSFEVKVIAPEASEEIIALSKSGELEYAKRIFEDSDIEGMDIVVVATDKREVNCEVGKLCRDNNILVSVADKKEECTFYFPAIVATDEVVIGITSEGKSHKLVSNMSKRLKKELNCED